MTATLTPPRDELAGLPARRGLRHRWRSVGAPPRIVGVDVARSLAIIGMVGAHVGVVNGDATGDIAWTRPDTWAAIVSGRSSLLFALLAGVSLALLTGGPRPPADVGRVHRTRLVGRGLAILVVGAVVEVLGTTVAVILGLYGVIFLLAPLFVGWSTRRLLLTALGTAVFGPPALATLAVLTIGANGPASTLLLNGVYPLPLWLAPLFVGLAVGRLDLTRAATAVRLVASGAGLAVLGYGIGALATSGAFGGMIRRSLDPTQQTMAADPDPKASYLDRVDAVGFRIVAARWLSDGPHTGGTPELLGGIGLGLLVLGLSLLLARRLRVVLVPLAALGSMPLTAYSAHVVAIMVLNGGPGGLIDTSNLAWLWMTVGLVAGCTTWALTLGRGPLERWTAWASRAYAR